uniref:Ppx/GppA phosphatase family protein n=1 Tax=Amycolatopsis alkalitolerans TaxID=2547244 RepID=UPI001F158A16
MHAVKEPTRLGEELQADGSLSERGAHRVAAAVRRTVEAAGRLEVELLYPFITAAIRDATNRSDVLDLIEVESGIRPQYLSGEEEARLTYFAAHRWYGWSSGHLLLIDIGGGSMELALGRDVEPDLAVSLPLGAGRLTRSHLNGDPPGRSELKGLRQHVRDTLSEVLDRLRWEGNPRRVVGTSKTFKQLARVAGAAPRRRGPFVKRELSLADLRDQIPRLTDVNTRKRAELKGISRPRAGQIVAGALTAEATMSALDVISVEICPWALREGVLLHHLEAHSATPELPLRALSRTAFASKGEKNDGVTARGTVTALPARRGPPA